MRSSCPHRCNCRAPYWSLRRKAHERSGLRRSMRLSGSPSSQGGGHARKHPGASAGGRHRVGRAGSPLRIGRGPTGLRGPVPGGWRAPFHLLFRGRGDPDDERPEQPEQPLVGPARALADRLCDVLEGFAGDRRGAWYMPRRCVSTGQPRSRQGVGRGTWTHIVDA